MDDKKTVKEFIKYVCDWVEHEYKIKNHICFKYEFNGEDRISYLIADKGSEKRIEKQLLKRLGLKSTVTYENEFSEYTYPNYRLRIKLLANKGRGICENK